MRSISRVAVVALALMTASPVRAQVVDQSQYGQTGGFAVSFSWSGQTFTPSANTSMGAGFDMRGGPGGYSGDLTINLWSGLPNSGTKLATGTTAFSLAQGEAAMIDVFWNAVAVTPGNQYFLSVFSYGSSPSSYAFTTYADASPYAGGGAFNNSSSNESSLYVDYSGAYDLTFEEFAASSAIATPEPESLPLLATGLLVIVAVMRQRRKEST